MKNQFGNFPFIFLTIVILIFFHYEIFPQWIEPSGFSSNINSFAKMGTILFAATDTNGVYLTINKGRSWKNITNGLEDEKINVVYASDKKVFIGTDNGIYLSENYGVSWQKSAFSASPVLSFVSTGNEVFAGTRGSGIIHSSDEGLNWSSINTDLTDTTTVTSLLLYKNLIFAGTLGSGIFRSTLRNYMWESTGDNQTNKAHITTMAIKKDRIFAAASTIGILSSDDEGISWKAAERNPAAIMFGITYLLVEDSRMYCGTNLALFSTDDDGTTWQLISFLSDQRRWNYIYAAIEMDSILFAGTEMGLFISQDQGNTWICPGLTEQWFYSFTAFGTYLYGASGRGVFRSSDNGYEWNQINNKYTTSIAASDSFIYITTYPDQQFYYSGDYGNTWHLSGEGINSRVIYANDSIVMTGYTNVFFSRNNGIDWDSLKEGLNDSLFITGIINVGGKIYISSYRGVYCSEDNGKSWKKLLNESTTTIAARDSLIITSKLFSTDYGVTWKLNNLGRIAITTLISIGKDFIAGTNSGVYILRAGSSKWVAINEGLPIECYVRALFVKDGKLFAGSDGKGIWRRDLKEIIN